jgi:hypothetical protein
MPCLLACAVPRPDVESDGRLLGKFCRAKVAIWLTALLAREKIKDPMKKKTACRRPPRAEPQSAQRRLDRPPGLPLLLTENSPAHAAPFRWR